MEHNRALMQEDDKKARPARPQRAKARGVTFLTRPPRAAKAALCPGRYVEGLSDARTQLEGFCVILLSARVDRPLKRPFLIFFYGLVVLHQCG
jgi:hypothetical protein